jgi:citrate lyase subunit beta/citryl-CoA lyase
VRSYLFVPGIRPDRFGKALASGADEVILDLEDAVPDGRKLEARQAVAGWLRGDRPVYVRVNAAGTQWHEGDLGAIIRSGLRGVVLPKAQSSSEISALAAALPSGAGILPIIESATGLWRAHEIAVSPRVERLAFGQIDFSLDTGVEDEEQLYARSHLVVASRVAGVMPPLDGVTTVLDDLGALRRDIERARRMGFGGKLCIHPSQVAAVNEGFRPTPAEVEWATRVMQAAGEAGGAATRVGGQMVDKPVVEQARRILARAHNSEAPE